MFWLFDKSRCFNIFNCPKADGTFTNPLFATLNQLRFLQAKTSFGNSDNIGDETKKNVSKMNFIMLEFFTTLVFQDSKI